MYKFSLTMLLSFLSLCFANAQPPNTQNALDLDGINDYVQTTFSGVSGTNPRTVEAWIKTTATADPNSGGVQQIITDWGVFATGSRFTFNVLWNNAIRLEVSGSGLSGNIAVNDGLWHHVAGVYDPTAASQLSLFVDGVLDVSGNIPTPINTLSGNMRIGERIDGARHFDGLIDEVRVWNNALTQAQLQANMNQNLCSLPNNLLAYYQFDEGVAGSNNAGITNLPDLSGNNNDGTLQNFALNGTISNWVVGAALLPGTGTMATISATSCGPYQSPSGNYTWTSSGTYADTIVNVAGCDSILTVNLDIATASFYTIAPTACDFYTSPSGTIWLGSGTYTDTIPNAAGCDSILTINLTVNSNTGAVIDTTTCGSYTAPSGTQSWAVSGTYTDIIPNASGCDSTLTINLTIATSSTESLFFTACDSFVSPSGNYSWTTSGSYLDTLTNAVGCDSILIIGLQIDNSSSSTLPVPSCGPYTSPSGNYVWTNSGTYSDTLLNTNNCPEYITIILTVVNLDTSVVQNNRDLIAQASGPNVSYQWLDCNNNYAPLAFEVLAQFTPVDAGYYAVEITQDGCVDTSACYLVSSGLGIVNTSFQTSIELYPNPSKGPTLIELGRAYPELSLWVYDLNGRLIARRRYQQEHLLKLDLIALPHSDYILRLQAEKEYAILKLRLH